VLLPLTSRLQSFSALRYFVEELDVVMFSKRGGNVLFAAFRIENAYTLPTSSDHEG